jgi:hypothetical protein
MMDKLAILALTIGLMAATGLASRLIRLEMLAELRRALPDRDIDTQVKWYPDETAGLTKLHRSQFPTSRLGTTWNILIGATLCASTLLIFFWTLLFTKLS